MSPRSAQNMVALPQALSLVDSVARLLDTEPVPLESAYRRLLVQPIRAPFPIPPFSKSAMDGFAVRSGDITGDGETVLRIIEMVSAGTAPRKDVIPGTAVQIMTGAPVPAGADQVVRVEYTRTEGDVVRLIRRERGTNIIEAGENAAEGDLLLSPGRLAVHDIGVAAAVGLNRLEVLRMPTLAIVSTGDELLEPGAAPAPGCIYNSNAYQLHAHALESGYQPSYHGIAADTENGLRAVLEPALATADVVALSGGVSKGEFDYVPRVLASLGVRTVFHHVAIKPGRPTYFGIRDEGAKRRYVFGLPGNPVSTYVAFELLAVRLLYRFAGLEPPEPRLTVTLGTTIEKTSGERTEFIPVRIEDTVAIPVPYGGSSHLNALSASDALLEVPVGSSRVRKGTKVHVRPL